MTEDRMIGVEDARGILGCSRQSVHNYVAQGRLEGEYRTIKGHKTLQVSAGSCHKLKAELTRTKYARTPESSKDTEESAELKHASRFSLEMREADEKMSRDAQTRAIEEQTRVFEEMSRKLDRLPRIERALQDVLDRMPKPGSGFDWLIWSPIIIASIAAIAQKLGVTMPGADADQPAEATTPAAATPEPTAEEQAAIDRAEATARGGEAPTPVDFQVWQRFKRSQAF